MSSTRRSCAAIDWDAIRRIYRTGLYSNMEIASQFGISESGIRQRAKREGWSKDLTDDVACKTQRKLLAEAVKELHAQRRAETRRRDKLSAAKENETAPAAQELRLRRERDRRDALESGGIIEQASEVCAAVTSIHRRDAKQARTICQTLFEQLDEAVLSRNEILSDVHEAAQREIDAAGKDRSAAAEARQRRNRMARAVSLPVHASTLRDLAYALQTLVSIEREAYGLDKGDPSNKSGVTVLFDVRF